MFPIQHILARFQKCLCSLQTTQTRKIVAKRNQSEKRKQSSQQFKIALQTHFVRWAYCFAKPSPFRALEFSVGARGLMLKLTVHSFHSHFIVNQLLHNIDTYVLHMHSLNFTQSVNYSLPPFLWRHNLFLPWTIMAIIFYSFFKILHSLLF